MQPSIEVTGRWLLPRGTAVPIDGVVVTGGSDAAFVGRAEYRWEDGGDPIECRDGDRPTFINISVQLALLEDETLVVESRMELLGCADRTGWVRAELPASTWTFDGTNGERDQLTVGAIPWDVGLLAPGILDVFASVEGSDRVQFSLTREGTFDES